MSGRVCLQVTVFDKMSNEALGLGYGSALTHGSKTTGYRQATCKTHDILFEPMGRAGQTWRKGDPMRQLNRSIVRFGRNERNFTEVEIVKLIKPRDHESLTGRILRDFPPNSTLIGVEAAAEPEQPLAFAKGAWA